jgi:uncharacterized membrane protein YdjX (TVP38/TMEM64 family)
MTHLPKLARLALTACLIALLALLVLNHALLDPQAMRVFLDRNHDEAIVIFLIYHVVASLFFVPRTLLGFTAGALFGLWLGLLLAIIGSTLGALAGLFAVRILNNGLIDPTRVPGIGKWLARAEQAGFRTALLIRLTPLPNSLVNYALGLSKIKTGPFILGSALGMLPVAIITVNMGASGADLVNGSGDLLTIVSWTGALIILTVVTAAFARKA